MRLKYQEPYFMQQLHKQRERDARELYRVFGGDIERWWNHKRKELDKSLAEQGYRLKRNRKGSGFLVRDKRKRRYGGKVKHAKCKVSAKGGSASG